MSLAEYKIKLSSLKVDRSSGHPKPHKVCLLLGLIDNKFILNEELETAFSFHFDRLKKGNDVNSINQPFYHLQSDGIWHFKLKSSAENRFKQLKEEGRTLSKKQIVNLIEYAYLDQQLFDYLKSDVWH